MPLTKRPTTTTQSKDQRSAYAFSKAYGDVGRTPEKVLEWLIGFGEKDLRTLSEREWGRWRNELTAFIDIGTIGFLGRNLHEAIVFLKNMEAEGRHPPPSHQGPLTLQIAKKLQSITKRAIKELIETGVTLLPEIAISPLIKKISKPAFGLVFKGMEVLQVPQRGQSVTHDRFIVHLQNVLKEVGTRLEFCHSPTCRKAFVMYRYGQLYCSKRCHSRVAMKEWRQKRKDEKSKPKGGAKHGTKRKQ